MQYLFFLCALTIGRGHLVNCVILVPPVYFYSRSRTFCLLWNTSFFCNACPPCVLSQVKGMLFIVWCLSLLCALTGQGHLVYHVILVPPACSHSKPMISRFCLVPPEYSHRSMCSWQGVEIRLLTYSWCKACSSSVLSQMVEDVVYVVFTAAWSWTTWTQVTTCGTSTYASDPAVPTSWPSWDGTRCWKHRSTWASNLRLVLLELRVDLSV